MTIPALVATLLANLPELVKLVRLIVRNIEEAQSDRKVKEDLRAIHEAFETRDAEALRRVFAPLDPPRR